MRTTASELCGVISVLQTYLIGTPHHVYLYTDHKPIVYLYDRQGEPTHQFFRQQLVISQFEKLEKIWTDGTILAFPDILGRNVKIKDLDRHQLKPKKIQKK